ncbi:MAG: FlgO family outer membrane protein [Desulfovibrionaceae bacterium]|nr:FlgO family outer membrane protein [Desulfovibrionaceae bacterium]
MKTIFFVLMLTPMLLLSGCNNAKFEMSEDAYPNFDKKTTVQQEGQVDIVAVSYQLADAIVNNMPATVDVHASKLIVVSFADINDLTKSSPFGRMLAEHVGSRLVQKGLKVADLRVMADTILIREQDGEFALSRNTKKLGVRVDTSLILAGTYARVSNTMVSVSVRLINGADNMVISTADSTLRL